VERLFAEINAKRIRRGRYASVNDLEAAIYDYLLIHNAKPKLDVLTLHGHLQADVTAPEDEVIGKGDYLLITHERMTRTH
jgi:hypothetical protein